jgi:hypothetical protein
MRMSRYDCCTVPIQLLCYVNHGLATRLALKTEKKSVTDTMIAGSQASTKQSRSVWNGLRRQAEHIP